MAHRTLRRNAAPLALAAAVVFSSAARAADDLFAVRAVGTGGTTVRVTGSSLIDLVNNLVKSEDEFRQLEDAGFSGSLTYAGIPNAIRIARNAAKTQATLRVPSIGLTKSFSAANEDDLNDAIEEYIKKEGADRWGQFLRQVNEQTTVGVTDGNPLATTALLSDSTYQRFGLRPSPIGMGDVVGLANGGEFRIDLAGGQASGDDVGDGPFVAGTISTTFRFADWISLSLASPFAWRQVDGADVFHVGGEVALPITLVPGAGERYVRWTVTPAFITGGGGSYDLAAGGLMYGGSVTSSLTLSPGGGLAVTLANQLAAYEGIGIDIEEFKYDTDVSQQVLKNGVQVSYAFGRAFVDAGVTYTNFLRDAAVDGWITPTAGVGLRFGDAGALRLGYSGDFGDGFSTNGGTAQVVFAW